MVASHAPGAHVKLGVLRDKQHRASRRDARSAERRARRARRANKAAERTSSARRSASRSRTHGGHAVVERVSPDGPADGKLRRGDVIEEVNRKPVTSASDASAQLRAAKDGQPVLLKVKRGDQSRFIAIEP